MGPKRHELYVLYLLLFLVLAGFGIVFPILPLLVTEFQATSLHMGLFTTLYALCQFLFAPLWGNVSDRYGRKPVLVLGLFGFSLSFFLMGLATSIEALLAARVLGGLLSAAAIPTAQAFAADASRPEERGAAMAHVGAAIGAGFMVGPLLGGGLSLLGLRAAFFFTAGLALFTSVLAAVALHEPPRPGERAARRLSSWAAVRYAGTGPEALLYWLAFVVTFCGSTLFSMLGLYLADRFGAGDASGLLTGVAFTVLGISSTVVQGLLLGPVLQRYGEERTILAGLVIGAVSFAALAVTPNYAGILLLIVGASTAAGLIRPTIAATASKRATLGQGTTMGIQAAFDSLGRVVGPLVAGAAYAVRMELPFAIASVLYLVAFLFVRRNLSARTPAADAVTAPAEADPRPGSGLRIRRPTRR